MLIPPLGEAREHVIYVAGLGRKQAERRCDTAQMNEADILDFRERPPAIKLKPQHAII